ncbi:hypothetical protein Tco_1241517 [Tanacetum coccineum]
MGTTGGGMSSVLPLLVWGIVSFVTSGSRSTTLGEEVNSRHYRMYQVDATLKIHDVDMPEEDQGGKNLLMNFETRSSHVYINGILNLFPSMAKVPAFTLCSAGCFEFSPLTLMEYVNNSKASLGTTSLLMKHEDAPVSMIAFVLKKGQLDLVSRLSPFEYFHNILLPDL